MSGMNESGSVKARKSGRGGRPSKGPRIAVTVRFPEHLADAIEEARVRSGLTTNDLIVTLTEKAMAAGLSPAAHDQLPLTA
jgi:hypothetical protein